MTTIGSRLSLSTGGGSSSQGAAGVGAQGLWLPTDLGLVAWNMDPGDSAANVTTAAGRVYLMRAKMQIESTISQVGLSLRSTAPAGLTNTYVGVYTQSGSTATLVGSSADISSSVNGVTVSTLYSLTTPTSVLPAGSSVLLAFLYGAATTTATFLGRSSGRMSSGFISSQINWRAYAWSTGLTALPATIDLSSGSAVDPGAPPCFVAA